MTDTFTFSVDAGTTGTNTFSVRKA